MTRLRRHLVTFHSTFVSPLQSERPVALSRQALAAPREKPQSHEATRTKDRVGFEECGGVHDQAVADLVGEEPANDCASIENDVAARGHPKRLTK